jgi:hypothetical protein
VADAGHLGLLKSQMKRKFDECISRLDNKRNLFVVDVQAST